MDLYELTSFLLSFLKKRQVEFHEMRAAETAIQTLNGRKIFDSEIRVNWAYQNAAPKEDLTNHYQWVASFLLK